MKAANLKPVTIPSTKIFRRATIICLGLLALTCVTPNGGQLDTGYALTISDSVYNDFNEFHDLVIDDDGFISKSMPQSGEYDRSELKDKFVHTVEEGENLSLIAQKYGLKKVSTLIWENNLSSSGYIKVGQKLVVPPTDGVSHKVAKGESLESVAKKYDIDVDKIVKQNGLAEGAKLALGETIFIPGGKKIEPPKPKYVAQKTVGTKVTNVNYVPSGDKPFIIPTSGTLTQGFHSGHYGHDIANTSRPHIWAAGAGTVVKTYTGGWGGGYGNHVIIDHGNGVQTLYAHLQSVYVKNGQRVEQGEVIGRMGRTGRVYGVTGIHLHFEVRVNGVKKNPWLYY